MAKAVALGDYNFDMIDCDRRDFTVIVRTFPTQTAHLQAALEHKEYALHLLSDSHYSHESLVQTLKDVVIAGRDNSTAKKYRETDLFMLSISRNFGDTTP